MSDAVHDLRDLTPCFEGAIPAVIATASADGTPNITYLSRVRMVDPERIALSNQFLSKTVRNLAENPRASVLLIDPRTYDEYRLCLVYERTERRGPIFDQLDADVELAATMHGMTGVFKLRAADIYRVQHIDLVPSAANQSGRPMPQLGRIPGVAGAAELAEVTARLSRCTDLDSLVGTTVSALADVLGFEHSVLLLLDEDGERLYTIASHGYDEAGVGSEAVLSEGIIGMAAARCTPIRVGNVRHLTRYSMTVRRSYEGSGHLPEREVPMPGLREAESRLAVPAMAGGQLVGVLAVENARPAAFDEGHEAVLSVVASVLANAIEAERAREAPPEPAHTAASTGRRRTDAPTTEATQVRFYEADGSVFLDGDYLIKGVAGRILWSLLRHHAADGRLEFTNREVRLDPTLELPEFRDNLESRLILLKRRLAERGAPVQIEKTGRGRFQLLIDGSLRLESVGA